MAAAQRVAEGAPVIYTLACVHALLLSWISTGQARPSPWRGHCHYTSYLDGTLEYSLVSCMCTYGSGYDSHDPPTRNARINICTCTFISSMVPTSCSCLMATSCIESHT